MCLSVCLSVSLYIDYLKFLKKSDLLNKNEKDNIKECFVKVSRIDKPMKFVENLSKPKMKTSNEVQPFETAKSCSISKKSSIKSKEIISRQSKSTGQLKVKKCLHIC